MCTYYNGVTIYLKWHRSIKKKVKSIIMIASDGFILLHHKFTLWVFGGHMGVFIVLLWECLLYGGVIIENYM